MQVRRATSHDVAAIAQVHVDSWKAAYVGQLPDDFLAGLSAADRIPLWEGIVSGGEEGPVGSTFVLQEADAVIGFLHMDGTRDPDGSGSVGEVTALYLAPTWWGQGGGGLLLAAGLEALRSEGYRTATLWVLAGNERARRMYEAKGWHLDGAEKVDASMGVTLVEVRYSRAL
jgi:GNAT superfamily N-acetyltransferase